MIKLEYYDLVRIVFLDGRTAEPDYPHAMTGFSRGRWEGSTLVVETDHLEPATITDNGLDHTEHVRVIERFRLSPDGKSLLATQEFEDPEVIENRGVRFIAWTRERGATCLALRMRRQFRAARASRRSISAHGFFASDPLLPLRKV